MNNMHDCVLVPCSLLTDPNNGIISCLLGDDETPSYEDICTYTCITGYELTVDETRMCQSNGSWTGDDGVCSRGKVTFISS